MGTRNLVCVFYKGVFVIAQYGQYEGNPQGQGTTILKFLHSPLRIDNLKAGLKHTYKPSESQMIDAQQEINNLRGLQGVAWQYFIQYPSNSWLTSSIMEHLSPSLSPMTGAGILSVVAAARESRKVPVSLNLDFAVEYGVCEWVYVIDLDQEVLEIFAGHQKKVPGHRFAAVGGDRDLVPFLVSSIGFSEMRAMDEQTFLNRVMDDKGDESE